jgi:hypothetical protein
MRGVVRKHAQNHLLNTRKLLGNVDHAFGNAGRYTRDCQIQNTERLYLNVIPVLPETTVGALRISTAIRLLGLRVVLTSHNLPATFLPTRPDGPVPSHADGRRSGVRSGPDRRAHQERLGRRKEADCSHWPARTAGHQAPWQPQRCPSAQGQAGR